MKKIFIISILALGFSSCKTTYETFTQDEKYGNHCPNPILVESVFCKEYMTLAGALEWSKTKYGNDVSIINMHWDVFSGVRHSSIFDVVRCSSDFICECNANLEKGITSEECQKLFKSYKVGTEAGKARWEATIKRMGCE